MMHDTRILRPQSLLPVTLLLAACGADDTLGVGEDIETTTAALGFFDHEDESDDVCRPGRARRNPLSVEFLGRYAAGLEGLESSAESTAVKRNRLYATNAEAASLDVVDVSNPAAPTLLRRVDLSAYGPAVQSVDVSPRGLVAVAVSGPAKTDPGTIVFLSEDGTALRTATVGSLPDMVVFTHDGRRLVVANEGEPDCYGAGCTDPLGSVSIVDVVPLRSVLPVRTVTFDGVAVPAGVRIFGPGATPSQDLEPEYVTISKDNRTAFVTLQENNAVAVINLTKGLVERILPLGYKDHSASPTTTSYEIQDPPSVGSTTAGQEVELGGLSGLFFEGRTSDGKLKFVAHTDRGPNGEPTGVLRPFLLPGFAPEIVRLEVDEAAGSIAITERIALKRPDGSPLTGLPNNAVAGGTASSPHQDETPVDLFGNVLPLDPLGGDFEGIVVEADGSFWMADEYRPAIYHFDATGTMLKRLIPVGAHAAVGLPVPPAGVAGELGIEALPAAIAQRRQNRGFEALAMQNGKLYAFVQSPIRNPVSLSNAALAAMKNVRLIEVDPVTFATRQFIYTMDNPLPVDATDTRADKIGDMTPLPGQGFLVIERDDDALPAAPAANITKKVYAFNLTGATDITSKDTLYAGKSLDQMTTAELAAVSVKPIAKVLHMDLVRAGYAGYEKVEGLAFIDGSTLAVVNDNDFQVAGITIDQTTGTFTPDPNPEPTVLGIIKMNQGIDASDRDNVINIRNWPVFGMYQPDAIASYKACGETYFVTANEGDAREYPGFAEEARARSVMATYPGVPEVADDMQLGRLTITKAPPGGDVSRPYVFGGRSVSIWNGNTGAQVWDSGLDFEAITAMKFPLNFNSNHEANEFDTRSDNKGPEPEGVAVGRVRGRNYAFVGLERIGGVMIYDISNPAAPSFTTYFNSRDFASSPVGPDAGPEVVRFVRASDSPTRRPLLVVSNEISGTVSLYGLD
jgi:predicted small secreted protein